MGICAKKCDHLVYQMLVNEIFMFASDDGDDGGGDADDDDDDL